jgi:cell division protein FtsN
VATKRGKSQARRNSGNSSGMPGWAWLVLGIVLTIAVVMFAPKFIRSSSGDGFFRPKPNPDAQPAAATGNDEAAASDETSTPVDATPKASDKPKATQYDFYTMLPGNEVRMSDAELAATAREEASRKTKELKAATNPVAAATSVPGDSADAVDDTSPAATKATATVTSTSPPATHAGSTNEPVQPPGNNTPYILQAGAFGASGDAEAIKAKVAMLGLSARVEGATINGKTIYRVRMGPYATASELAEAKHKLASGGLPAMAIKAK